MEDWKTAYPRPLLRRDSFFPIDTGWTLNGRPVRVPWPPESELSGIGSGAGDTLDYRTRFTLPEGFLPEGFRAVLNLGAVDQTAEVYVNGKFCASHEGGYMPFAADMTDLLRPGENDLRVLARDTLSPDFPYGKQCREPHGMWYTPVSGIWQPVWAEAVPASGAVRSIRALPDLSGVTLHVDAGGAEVTVAVPAAGVTVSGAGELRLDIPSPHLWTPEDPYIYDFTVSTRAETVRSYFALRTVTLARAGGHMRVMLNGRPVFLHGVLDQGYFHDGLFLPSSPGEYARDIRRMRDLGFNTLRKHIKVEPEAFYESCDRLGMLVIQDMVNSGPYSFFRDTALPTAGFKRRRDTFLRVGSHRRELFEGQVRQTQERLFGHPCVIGYTLFNEGWGQYDSDRLYEECRARDHSRFYDSTSGWFAQRRSDAESIHLYFRDRVLPPPDPLKFLFLSECGGFSRPVPGHTTAGRKNYGYGRLRTTERDLTEKILSMYRSTVLPSMKNGLSAVIYTQLSDVEGETNGLYTYDRKLCKVTPAPLRSLASRLYTEFARETRER